MSYELESRHSSESKLEELFDALGKLGMSPYDGAGWELRKLRQYRGALLAHAPLRVGDRAVLTDPPEIDPSSGWYQSRHFIIKGALATVSTVDWHVDRDEPDAAKGRWVVAVKFDAESRRSEHDEQHKRLPDGGTRLIPTPPERRHTYMMAARRLVKTT